jgi:hypothetical protein
MRLAEAALGRLLQTLFQYGEVILVRVREFSFTRLIFQSLVFFNFRAHK